MKLYGYDDFEDAYDDHGDDWPNDEDALEMLDELVEGVPRVAFTGDLDKLAFALLDRMEDAAEERRQRRIDATEVSRQRLIDAYVAKRDALRREGLDLDPVDRLRLQQLLET
jgi:hypothetical protein